MGNVSRKPTVEDFAAFAIYCKSMSRVSPHYFSTIVASLSGLLFSALIVSVLKLCAVFPQTVMLPHSSLMLTWLRRKRRSPVFPMFDDSLMNTLPPITPTVKLLHIVRHHVCFSYRSLRWTCLPAVFFLHLELFIPHLTLYLTWLLNSLSAPSWLDHFQ